MAQEHSNIVSVSWGDHLAFGDDEGRLDTPEKLSRGIADWQQEFGASKILWRDQRIHRSHYLRFEAPGTEPRPTWDVPMDEFQVLIEEAHAQNAKVYLYIDMFDEGWPLAPPEVRAVSYHNRFHAKVIATQSRFTIENPEFLAVDRSGKNHQHGIMCYAYPEVRDYRLALYQEVLADYDFDGLFICTRSQSRPADHADQFGFNTPIVEEYQRRHGVNILEQDFDLDEWRKLRGEYLTQFFRQVKTYLQTRDMRFAVGIPRGDVIGPPVGNLRLDWRNWVAQGIVDELVIDQVARVCPSTWLKLWPMHNGYGYVSNYYTGLNMPSLKEEVVDSYGPWCSQHGVELYLARMWHPYDRTVEEDLLRLPGVTGLVFGSFRRDNPDAIESDLWYFRTD